MQDRHPYELGMTATGITTWRNMKQVDSSLLMSSSYGIETILKSTDVDIIIYELSVFNPEGKSKTISFCSFNHNHPTPSKDINGEFKTMYSQFVKKMMNQLSAEHPSPKHLNYVECVNYNSKFRVECKKVTTGFYHWKKVDNKDEVEINKVNNNHAVTLRKNLLLWFWLHGKKMFNYHIMKTSKQISYIDNNKSFCAFIAQVYWIFEQSMDDTNLFLKKLCSKIKQFNCVYKLFWMDMGPNSNGPVTYTTQLSDRQYFWVPYNFPGHTCKSLRQELVIDKLNLLIWKTIYRNHPRLNFPSEMTQYILAFLSETDIDFFFDLFNKFKIRPIVENFMLLCLSQNPIPFFQSIKKDDGDFDNFRRFNPTMKEVEIARQKKFVMFD